MHVEVAAWGWLGERWAASYPADLPEEWRLDYYANEYEAVVVPSSDWQAQDRETLQLWLEEAPEGFHFYWELEGGAPAPLLGLYNALKDETAPGGWLLSQGGLAKGAGDELSELAPVALCEPKGEFVGNGLIVLAAEKEPNLRQLRERLDTLAAQGTETVVLTVHPSVDASELLHRLHTLCRLYRS
ncbi:MAG: DUF72 domain-containing protein [Pseudomonadota bacterium]